MVTSFINNVTNDNISILIVIASALIVVFSTLGALIEYFSDEAYYDYYWVRPFSKKQMRVGFHPNFLYYSIIITPLIIVIFPYIESLFSYNLYQSILYGSIVFVIYIIVHFFILVGTGIFSIINPQKHGGLWKSYKNILSAQFRIALPKTFKYGTIILGLFISLLLLNHQKSYIGAILTIIISFTIFVWLHYYSCQKKIALHTRYYSILRNENGDTYALISETKALYYTVQCEINKNNVINLYLDKIKMFEQNTEIEIVRVSSHVRYIFNNKIDK